MPRNNRLILNGWKIVGSAFSASVKPLVQHGRASSKEHHSCPSHLQADLKAVTFTSRFEDTNLGTGGGQQPWQIYWMLLSFVMFLESFHWCFGTSSGMERPLLVMLPIEESVVKLLPSAGSLWSSYYLTPLARSSFIKHMRLTRYGKTHYALNKYYALNRELRLTTKRLRYLVCSLWWLL